MINLYYTPKPPYYNKLDIESLNINHKKYNIINHSNDSAKFLHWFLHNEHHWAPHSAMEFFRKLLINEGLNINIDKYVKIEKCKWCNHNVDLYRPTTGNYVLNVGDYELHGDSSILYTDKIRLYTPNYKSPTLYHKQFIGSHQNISIRNSDSLLGCKIVLACDSMSIPYIPLLSQICSQLDILEYRDKQFKSYNCKDYDRVIFIQEIKSPYKLIKVFDKLIK